VFAAQKTKASVRWITEGALWSSKPKVRVQLGSNIDKRSGPAVNCGQEMQAVSHQEVLTMNGHCETTLHAELAQLGSKDANAKGLLIVGLFKLSKALFFAALGFGALHLVHHDLGDLVMRVAEALRMTSESRIVNFAMERADLVGHHQLREASMLSFGYAGLCLIEGTGLVMRRVWAEYFTVVLTVMGLPWESYELMHRFTWLKVGLLAINLLVLAYLLWVLKRKRDQDCGA
jgi:uncharacterized membrane protein (DUF2068 family)